MKGIEVPQSDARFMVILILGSNEVTIEDQKEERVWTAVCREAVTLENSEQLFASVVQACVQSGDMGKDDEVAWAIYPHDMTVVTVPAHPRPEA